MKEIIISENESQQRLDRFLIKLMPQASKDFIQKMIRKKNITCNQQKATPAAILKKGDRIQIFFSDQTYLKFTRPTTKKLERKVLSKEPTFTIIEESDDLLVVNKPANLLTQPDKSGEISLIDLVLDYLINSGAYQPHKELTFKPACSNRLDRNTTGIILIPKNYPTLQTVNRLIREKKIRKYYLALVAGNITTSASCLNFGHKDPRANFTNLSHEQTDKNSKLMTLTYEPLENRLNTTLLGIDLLTGHSHQIRAQLAGIGHPILGDPKYGNKLTQKLNHDYGLSSQLLHSYNYAIPDLNWDFRACPPLAFQKFAASLGYRFFLKES